MSLSLPDFFYCDLINCMEHAHNRDSYRKRIKEMYIERNHKKINEAKKKKSSTCIHQIDLST